MPNVQQINQLLPQTQCRECGFSGCLPYAEALVKGEAELNLCAAGGEVVMLDLANVLQRTPKQPEKIQPKTLAWIDETVCIGCTACIRACPVDAIMGASKLMHTVLSDECTGCGLCVAPCPVDCIYLIDVADEFLPRNHYLADQIRVSNEPRFQAAYHAQSRYEQHNARKQRENEARQAKLAAREAANKQPTPNSETSKTAFNPAHLIAQAMAKAQAQQNQRVVPNNRADFQQIQIQKAQEKAAYSRAMMKMQYGNEDEKAVALAWLREYKLAQEEKLNQ